jgi:hypothetical protein
MTKIIRDVTGGERIKVRIGGKKLDVGKRKKYKEM